MKKFIKLVLLILFVLVIASSALLFWQRDNITALINGMKYSSKDLASQLDSKREDLKSKVEKYVSSPINDLSAEDEQKLFKGEITVKEVSEKYNLPLNVMEGDSNKDSETAANADSMSVTDNSKAIDTAISTGISRMYALKAKYVSKLGELERLVYNEYSKLPKEKQNSISKKEIITKNLNYIADMEQKCDKEVDEVLSLMEKELEKLKGDTEIIKILKDSYKNEKELKKSYYFSLYTD